MPLAQWSHYRQTRTQKKKALHLLALSGVIRPSTVELRYAISPLRISAEPTSSEQPETPRITPATHSSDPPMNSLRITILVHQLYVTAGTLLRESKRQIQRLQWDNRTTA